jgi:hypothetical protein
MHHTKLKEKIQKDLESFQIMSPKRWTPCCNVMFKTFMLVCLYISSAGNNLFIFTLNGLQDTWR